MDPIERHCSEIERTNQRGGRMLSLADLILAGTLDRDLAAYFLAAVRRGASFLVGALPGGAGKTTVMGALLGVAPEGVDLVAADGPAAIAAGLKPGAPRRLWICHEIGDGPYYAYLWGEDLRAYFRLAGVGAGHILATNLHADTYEEAREQICGENGVPQADFHRLHLCLFLELRRGARGMERRIGAVWEGAGDGSAPHRQVRPGGSLAGGLVPGPELTAARDLVDHLIVSGARTLEEVRRFVLAEGPTAWRE